MENFKTVTHKRGRGRSPEVIFYKRLQLQGLLIDWENFGLLQMKSLIFAYGWGCLQEMVVIFAYDRGNVAHGDSTLYINTF